MRKAFVSGLILAGLAGGIAAPSLVAAQTAAPEAAQAPAPASPAPQRPERHHARPGERIDARLAYLKTALKITPAQEKQWAALAAVLRRQAQDMDAKMQQRRDARQTSEQTQTQPSAIERLEQRQQFLADAAKRTGAVVAAAKPLYASFNPEQKQTADELLAHSGHHFRHGWR